MAMGIGVLVSVGVRDAVGMAVSIGVLLSVGVGDAVGMAVGLGVLLSVGVGDAVGMAVGLGVLLSVGVGDAVGMAVGVVVAGCGSSPHADSKVAASKHSSPTHAIRRTDSPLHVKSTANCLPLLGLAAKSVNAP